MSFSILMRVFDYPPVFCYACGVKTSRLIGTLAVLCFFACPLFAQESAVPHDNSLPTALVVSRIKITGLKRTRQSYMQSVLGKYRGIPLAELDLNDVEITLREQGLFSDITVSCGMDESGYGTLFVTVAEKISFLPVPFAMYASGTGFMGGLIVMDTNAFGVKDTYLAGGIFSSSMQTAIMAFSKPSLALTKPGFSVSGSFAHRGNKVHDGSDSLALAYRTIGGGAEISLTDKLTEHTNASIGLRYDYTHISLDDDFSAYQDDLSSYHAFSVNATWGARFSQLNEWFLSTKSVRVTARATWFFPGSWAQFASVYCSIQQNLPVRRLRVVAQGSGHYSHGAPVPLWVSQTAVGTTIMPDKFVSQKMLGAHAGLEFAVAKTKFATFSIYGLYEQFFGEDFDGSGILNFGYSAGAKMYLAKISLPALAVGFSHNVSQNKIKFSVALGIGF